MRVIFAATAAVLFAAALSVNPATAQKKKAVEQMSVNQCIDLARKRGFSDADFSTSEGGKKGNPARTFVIRCLQGTQR